MQTHKQAVIEYFKSKGLKIDSAFAKKRIVEFYENYNKGAWICSLLNYYTKINISGKKILDIGSASGGLLVYCAKQNAEAHGIDTNVMEIKVAQALASEKQAAVTITQSSAASLPYDDNTFDVAFLIDLLEHSGNLKAIIKEALRVVKTDGILFIKQHNGYFPYEPHTQLWGINYLPRKLASWIIKKVRPEFFLLENSLDDVRYISYFNIKNATGGYNRTVRASFTTLLPYVADFSNTYIPFKIKLPGFLKKMLASKLLQKFLSIEPFIWFAKDWHVIIKK